MDSVNKTLYIPLFGKAYISRRGILLNDPMAERIWAAEGFPLKGKSRSRWLACYMAMRAAVFDRWLREQLALDPAAAVVHIGCGMDSRCLRVDHGQGLWFDLDFPEVIRQRRRYYPETDRYKMLGSDVRSADWLSPLPGGNAVVVMEGVSMYLRPEELSGVLSRLREHLPLSQHFTKTQCPYLSVKNQRFLPALLPGEPRAALRAAGCVKPTSMLRNRMKQEEPPCRTPTKTASWN